MYYNYIKALHLIFVITWFAGLFYVPRLFIYHIEATKKSKIEADILIPQFKIMTKRLWYIITWPSAILASFFAFVMLYLLPEFLTQPWMWIKLSFVFLLYLYQWGCQIIYRQLQNDIVKYSASQLRIWNEGATIILFSVVFLVLYVLYHMTSDSTEYKGEGLLRYLYFFILISHIVLSIAVIPFVLITYVRAITNQVELHKKIAKYTFPLWLYVAVTGVVVYWMISPYYVL